MIGVGIDGLGVAACVARFAEYVAHVHQSRDAAVAFVVRDQREHSIARIGAEVVVDRFQQITCHCGVDDFYRERSLAIHNCARRGPLLRMAGRWPLKTGQSRGCARGRRAEPATLSLSSVVSLPEARTRLRRAILVVQGVERRLEFLAHPGEQISGLPKVRDPPLIVLAVDVPGSPEQVAATP